MRKRIQRAWTLSAALSGMLFSAACGGGGSTGPAYPALAGTYVTTYDGIVGSPIDPDGEISTTQNTGSITLFTPDANGNFHGSDTDGSQEGFIAGVEQANGDINISQFGSANVPPLESLAQEMYQAEYPLCPFGDATGAATIGKITGDTLAVQNTLTVECTYMSPGQTLVLPTTFMMFVSAIRS